MLFYVAQIIGEGDLAAVKLEMVPYPYLFHVGLKLWPVSLHLCDRFFLQHEKYIYYYITRRDLTLWKHQDSGEQEK